MSGVPETASLIATLMPFAGMVIETLLIEMKKRKEVLRCR